MDSLGPSCVGKNWGGTHAYEFPSISVCYVPTAVWVLQVARHRDILQEFTHEFRRTRSILAAGAQRDALLGGRVGGGGVSGNSGGGFGYGEPLGGGASTAEMLRERNAIGSAAANMDNIILQVGGVGGKSWEERGRLRDPGALGAEGARWVPIAAPGSPLLFRGAGPYQTCQPLACSPRVPSEALLPSPPATARTPLTPFPSTPFAGAGHRERAVQAARAVRQHDVQGSAAGHALPSAQFRARRRATQAIQGHARPLQRRRRLPRAHPALPLRRQVTPRAACIGH